jgi:cell division septum initiation protein DivIVA
MSGYFAFVRNLQTGGGSNIKDFAQISSAEAHAKRLDATSQARQVKGRSHEDNHFWSLCGEGLEGGGTDYVTAFKEHKKRHAITSERKGAAIAQHLLVGVSPGWLEDAGDPRDTANPRVQQLVAEAKAWAESWMGEGAVWAVRYDTDEKGAGVVDILASPIRTQHHKTGKSKPAISVRKANAELAEKHGLPNAFQAMQTDWAEWSQSRLDPQLQRGRPKSETDREHVPPDIYAAQIAEIEQQREALAKEREAFEKEKAEHEKTVELVEDGVRYLSNAIESALDGTHDEEFESEYAYALRPLKSIAPQNRVTNGFLSRCFALFGTFTVTEKELVPLPEYLLDSLTECFDRVALWAAEVRKVRQEAQKILQDATEAAKDAAKGILDAARADAAQITQEATQMATDRLQEVERYAAPLTQSERAKYIVAHRLHDFVKEVLASKLPPQTVGEIRQTIRDGWAVDPRNPERKVDHDPEPPQYDPWSSGPSR